MMAMFAGSGTLIFNIVRRELFFGSTENNHVGFSDKLSPCPPTGIVSNRSPNPAIIGLPFAIAACTDGSASEAW